MRFDSSAPRINTEHTLEKKMIDRICELRSRSDGRAEE